MKINDVTLKQWNNTLKATLKKEGNFTHKYVGINKDEDIELFSNLNSMRQQGYRKMRISEIVEQSKKINNAGISNKNATKITKNLLLLCDAKEKKVNQLGNRIGRFALLFFKEFFGLFYKPIGLLIERYEKKNITPHLNEIKIARQQIQLQNHENIGKFLDEVEQILKNDNVDEKLNRQLQKIVKEQVEEGIKEGNKSKMLEQFRKDHTRPGLAFTILDKNRPNPLIKDKTQIVQFVGTSFRPSNLANAEDKHCEAQLQIIKTALSPVVEDKKWLDVIQAIANQTAGNAAMTSLKANALGYTAALGWHNNNFQNYCRIEEDFIPIHLVLVRNSRSKEIEKIEIVVSPTSYVYQYEDIAKGTGATRKVAKIETRLKFQITLDKNDKDKVEVSKLSCSHQMERLPI